MARKKRERYLIIDPQRHMQFGVIFSSWILSFFFRTDNTFPGKLVLFAPFITSVSLSIEAMAINVYV